MEEERKLKILMLEDNIDDVYMIERTLKKDNLAFERSVVDTRDEFFEAVRSFKPDIVLSDHGLPGFNSREALKISIKELPLVPFILVTGTVTDDYAITCLRDGADDYVLKSNLSRLPSAIRSAVKKRKLEKLKREARHALRKQNEELLKVNKELDNFVYSVSHNLRGPLASLIGLLGIARDEDKEKKLQNVFSMMDKSMFRLDETLKEILDYSRNARGELSLNEIHWKSLVDENLIKLRYLTEDVDMNVHVDVVSSSPFVCDTSRLVVVMHSLLSNAIIFRDKRKKLFIDVQVLANSQEAKLIISDNGIGIDPQVMPKVFDMFYRGSEESQGAGLGLYISREIIRKLGGKMLLESEPGEGAMITITLPNYNRKKI